MAVAHVVCPRRRPRPPCAMRLCEAHACTAGGAHSVQSRKKKPAGYLQRGAGRPGPIHGACLQEQKRAMLHGRPGCHREGPRARAQEYNADTATAVAQQFQR